MKQYLSLVKFSHTIFAMPFAMLGVFLGYLLLDQDLEWRPLVLVVLCMIFARNAAMAFNRYLDRDIDSANLRTQIREIPSGVINPRSALIFVIVNVVLFIVTTYFINELCFYLSPIALFVVLGYSYTKRFTALCHMVLGLGLALAPIGAYLAITGAFNLIPVLYGLAVLFWVSGFDIIYALQDINFDRAQNLHSTPVALGAKGALNLSKVFHVISAGAMIAAGYLLSQLRPEIGIIHWVAVLIFCALLIYQHSLVRHDNLERVNLAFFTTNGLASFIFAGLWILDIYL